MALELQLDASAIAGKSDGDRIQTWADTSGKGRDVTQATEAERPKYKTGVLFEKPVVRFAGAEFLRATGFSVSQPDTVFVVSKNEYNGVTEDPKVFDGAVDEVPKRQLLDSSKTGTRRMFAGSSLTFGAEDKQFHLYTLLFNGASSSARVDGVGAASGNAGTSKLEGITVGQQTAAISNKLTGDVAELRVYSGALSEGERNAIEAALLAKWLDPEKPGVATGEATGITTSAASLHGTIDPNEFPTTYYFEYGLTEAYGSEAPVAKDGEAGSGSEAIEVEEPLSGLAAETLYHFRLVAENIGGEDAGEDETFTTAEAAVPPPPPAPRVTTPHFATPFRITNAAYCVEQDSTEEIEDCVETILRTPVGSRIEVPEFGTPDETFAQLGTSPTAETYLGAVADWEPRAHLIGEARFGEVLGELEITISEES